MDHAYKKGREADTDIGDHASSGLGRHEVTPSINAKPFKHTEKQADGRVLQSDGKERLRKGSTACSDGATGVRLHVEARMRARLEPIRVAMLRRLDAHFQACIKAATTAALEVTAEASLPGRGNEANKGRSSSPFEHHAPQQRRCDWQQHPTFANNDKENTKARPLAVAKPSKRRAGFFTPSLESTIWTQNPSSPSQSP